MRFDERFLEEIKSRLRLSDVIGRTVKLRRQGREYVGLSPFSKEKSPSFFVNDDKGFFHDFSSGKHGDLIAFLQETERLSFPEAVERLAAEAGVPMPIQDARSAEAEIKRQGLGDWLELAAAWFEAQLRRPAGDGARAYLDRRALPEAERTRFRIGYAPASRTALKDYLIAKGAGPGALVDAGLLIAPEDGGAPYDRFRDRIIFPIADLRGRVISFGGRALDPGAHAKYLNGPETELFHKGSTLYGLGEARRLLHTNAPSPGGDEAALVVVEGYMDVIACQRAGIAAAAPLGTALTEEQMAALWRLHPEPTLCFDADAAGGRAAARVIDRALPLLKPGRSFRFALISGGKDPDDVLREQGAPALKTQLAQTRPFVQALFERELEAAQPLETPERRTALKVSLRKLAGTIADKDLSLAYREDLFVRNSALAARRSVLPDASEAGRSLGLKRWSKHRERIMATTPEGKLAAKRLSETLPPYAAAAARGVILQPYIADESIETVNQQYFGQKRLAGFAHAFVGIRISHEFLRPEELSDELTHRGFGRDIRNIYHSSSLSHAPFLRLDYPPEERHAIWITLMDVLTRLAGMERALDQLKAEITESHQVMNELWRLKSERDALERVLRAGEVWKQFTAGQAHGTLH